MTDLRQVDCIFYDFDGVMTDNRVLVSDDGHESALCNRSDGLAVGRIKELGIPQVIISTELNPVVEMRAEKLGIEVIHGMSDKAVTLKVYCKSHDYDLGKCVFIGNDLNDLEAMKLVGLAGAPADAWPEAAKLATWISRKKGGEGVVAEFYRELLQVRGLA